jgi:hypothetical protein
MIACRVERFHHGWRRGQRFGKPDFVAAWR